ncbi:unnamed protein product [Agarophyton chilense]|eukprot:gb/GEZJ01000891.1/.p6 GENE.gb/GEZJ01000891.1/~~gb/GEZJ01000891.1/.p6  ORF type:complete len:280 (+),score=54.86 gb/GEZJ01000891.1/:1822-2661(+)
MDLLDFSLAANAIEDPAQASSSAQPAAMQNLLNANHSLQQQTLPWGPAADIPFPSNPTQQAQSSSAPQPAAASSSQPSTVQKRPNSNPLRPTNFVLDEDPPIDQHVVGQMGGLAFADHCKERARERFKELKKTEHMANGEFDRMKRRKKGDTSMTPRQKYLRRLRMNQDSAAAARHAQEVYVHVLEKLVRTSEDDKKAMATELQSLRQENFTLHNRVSDLETVVGRQPAEASFMDPSRRPYDPIQVAKLVDMLTAPQTVSAEAADPDFARECIQPAHAV